MRSVVSSSFRGGGRRAYCEVAGWGPVNAEVEKRWQYVSSEGLR